MSEEESKYVYYADQERAFHNYIDKLEYTDEIIDKMHQRCREKFMIASQNALEAKKNITKCTEAADNKEERQHQQMMADKKLASEQIMADKKLAMIREENKHQQIMEEKRANTLREHNKNLNLKLKYAKLNLKTTRQG